MGSDNNMIHRRVHRGIKFVEPHYNTPCGRYSTASFGWLPNFRDISTPELVNKLNKYSALKDERDNEFIQSILEEITERNRK